MKTYLYFDTETSDYHEPPGSPSLPCEIAAILADEDRVYSTLSFVIDQSKWIGIRLNQITERVIKIHGITNEIAAKFGQPPDIILNQFRSLLSKADAVVAHNIVFDIGVMDHVMTVQELPQLAWPDQICTMRLSAPIVGIPSKSEWAIDGTWKPPKLSEAYKHFAGREMSGAHNALVDAYGCKLVHKGCLRHAAESLVV